MLMTMVVASVSAVISLAGYLNGAHYGSSFTLQLKRSLIDADLQYKPLKYSQMIIMVIWQVTIRLGELGMGVHVGVVLHLQWKPPFGGKLTGSQGSATGGVLAVFGGGVGLLPDLENGVYL